MLIARSPRPWESTLCTRWPNGPDAVRQPFVRRHSDLCCETAPCRCAPPMPHRSEDLPTTITPQRILLPSRLRSGFRPFRGVSRFFPLRQPGQQRGLPAPSPKPPAISIMLIDGEYQPPTVTTEFRRHPHPRCEHSAMLTGSRPINSPFPKTITATPVQHFAVAQIVPTAGRPASKAF